MCRCLVQDDLGTQGQVRLIWCTSRKDAIMSKRVTSLQRSRMPVLGTGEHRCTAPLLYDTVLMSDSGCDTGGLIRSTGVRPSGQR
jgi:hypothetical protein